jgi:Domain of unknown function (DUF4386)
MDSTRKISLLTGVLFTITIVASIPALGLYGPVLNDAHYVLGGGADTRIYAGALLEVITAAAGIGTAVTLFPVLKRQSEGLALGYVTARVVESAVIVVGIVSVLSVVTMRHNFAAGPDASAGTYVVAGQALVALHKWTFLLGPGFCAGAENGLLLGYLLYRSRLVPRPLAVLGLVAGSLAVASAIAELFGLYQQFSATAAIVVFPEALFEAALGGWLIVKGFRPSPVIQDPLVLQDA